MCLYMERGDISGCLILYMLTRDAHTYGQVHVSWYLQEYTFCSPFRVYAPILIRRKYMYVVLNHNKRSCNPTKSETFYLFAHYILKLYFILCVKSYSCMWIFFLKQELLPGVVLHKRVYYIVLKCYVHRYNNHFNISYMVTFVLF